MNEQNVWKKITNPDEEIKYEFSIGNYYRKIGIITWGIISIPLLFLAGVGILTFLIALFYYGWYLKKANNYAFTDKRILVYTGWLSTKLISVDYNKITDIYVKEPFLDRVFNKTGSLAINTAGTNLSEIILKHIENPYEIKKKLDELRN